MKYHFLAGYLPDIQRDDTRININRAELVSGFYRISPRDLKEIDLILLANDVFMVERLVSGRPVRLELSLYDLDFWRDQVKSPRGGPEFILEFLQSLQPENSGPRIADRLLQLYYDYAISRSRYPFLVGYLEFERNLRLIAGAVRARQKGGNLAGLITGESELERALARSDAEDFGLGEDYPWIGELIRTGSPAGRQDLLENILWDFLEERAGNDPFHFNAILAYLLKLGILERKLALSREEGMAIVRRLEGQGYA